MLKKSFILSMSILILITSISPCFANEFVFKPAPVPAVAVALSPLAKVLLRIVVTWLMTEGLTEIKNYAIKKLKPNTEKEKYTKEEVQSYLEKTIATLTEVQKKERGLIVNELARNQKDLLNNIILNYTKLFDEFKSLTYSNKREITDRIDKIIQENILQTDRINLLEANQDQIAQLDQRLTKFEDRVEDLLKNITQVALENRERIKKLEIAYIKLNGKTKIIDILANYLLYISLSSAVTAASLIWAIERNSQLNDLTIDMKNAPNNYIYYEKLNQYDSTKRQRNIASAMAALSGGVLAYFLIKYFTESRSLTNQHTSNDIKNLSNNLDLHQKSSIAFNLFPEVNNEFVKLNLNITF